MGLTPTINVQNSNSGQYPSLEAIMDLVRALVNDAQAGATGTPGEGQILTDNPQISPFTQPFLNSAIREVYRELRNVGQPTLIKDNVIVYSLPVIDSPTNGSAQSDPTVQTSLSFNGYFDGMQLWPNVLLPSDMLYPEKLWERESGTNNPFVEMKQPQFGLPNGYQGTALGQWEWRNDMINFVGATTQRDIRIRYYAWFPTFFSSILDFSSTFVPIMDSLDAIAYKCAVKYATMLGSPGKADLQADAKEQMYQLKQANTRRMQSQDFQRRPYGSNGNNGGAGNFGSGFGPY